MVRNMQPKAMQSSLEFVDLLQYVTMVGAVDADGAFVDAALRAEDVGELVRDVPLFGYKWVTPVDDARARWLANVAPTRVIPSKHRAGADGVAEVPLGALLEPAAPAALLQPDVLELHQKLPMLAQLREPGSAIRWSDDDVCLNFMPIISMDPHDFCEVYTHRGDAQHAMPEWYDAVVKEFHVDSLPN